MPVEIRYCSGVEAPLFANRTSDLHEAYLETTFEGWKFAQDTQYYFHNGTNGVLKVIIHGPADEKENFGTRSEVNLKPGEAFEEKEWNRNFQVKTPDDKLHEAKGKINQCTESRYRYFYYANAENEFKVIKGEMVEGVAWSRWRPLELMAEPEPFHDCGCGTRTSASPEAPASPSKRKHVTQLHSGCPTEAPVRPRGNAKVGSSKVGQAPTLLTSKVGQAPSAKCTTNKVGSSKVGQEATTEPSKVGQEATKWPLHIPRGNNKVGQAPIRSAPARLAARSAHRQQAQPSQAGIASARTSRARAV